MEHAQVKAIFDRWFEALNRGGDPEREYEDRHPDCVIQHPQSGEVFDRDGMLGMQREYPDPAPKSKLVRLTGHGDEWTVEATLDYGPERGGTWPVVVTCGFKDGKIIRETRYFAEPFEAPEGRAKWTKGGGGG
ncbi:MAG: nuclear transport factor 2 family protein [Solirubrobacterales bacterium]